MIYNIPLLTSFFFSIFSFFTVHATGEEDITSQNFVVNISNMDPLGNSHAGAASGGGISALTTLLGKVADILLFMIPIIAVVSLLIAGYFYIFSAGDSEKSTKAKTIIKWNIAAMLVAFLSYGIVQIVAGFFAT